MRFLFCLALASVLAMPAEAKMQTQVIEYEHGDAVLEGYLAYDDSQPGKRPGVLVVHDWTGLGAYAKKRAEMLAEQGYVAFAADMYGKGIRPTTPEECGKQAGIYRSDRALMRARVAAGLDVLLRQERVEHKKCAAIGYCFGGGVCLEFARSGADLAAVVSFHGNLDTPNPEDAKNVKAKILVCHGADDPFVPAEQVMAFEDEMRRAGVDWQLIAYGNAVHSFTRPDAGNDKSKGAAYDERADKRSWAAMQGLFDEVFR